MRPVLQCRFGSADDNVYEESSDLEEEQPDDIEAISDFSGSPRIDPGGTTW